MPLAVATPLGSVGGVATPAPAYRSISGASSSNGTNGLSERALDKIQDALEKINEVLSTPNPTKALLSSLKEIVKPVLQQCRSNQEMRKALKHLCAGGSSDDLFAGVTFVRSNPAILGTISLDLFAVLFGGVTALLPIYARDILQTGPLGLGILRAAPAVGRSISTCSTSIWARPMAFSSRTVGGSLTPASSL